MAGLNRDFLVPYLQNLCTLHLALRKIEQITRKVKYQIFEAENGVLIDRPQRKEYIKEKNGLYYSLMAVGCVVTAFCAMFAVLNFVANTRIALPWTWAGLLGGTLLLVLPHLLVRSRREQNSRIDTEFEAEFASYRENLNRALEESAAMVSALKQQIQKWEQEKLHVESLLRKAYDVNVIPESFRNLHAALYLYEWACIDSAGDISLALGDYRAEDLQEKLNHIILTQSDAMLFHRKSIAEPLRSPVSRKQENRTQKVLQSMTCNETERDVYRKMLAVDKEATAYFTVSDYLLQM
jgi:hypothetical protein